MKKESVETLEYRGGYALVQSLELQTVIEGYKEGKIKKDALRVFAAQMESRALHSKSKVDLSRILNCKASNEGIKRLRSGIIRKAESEIDSILKPLHGQTSRPKAVSRKILRGIAQGRTTANEAIVLFMFSLRRISQAKPLKRLIAKERYARFTYRELSELSGIPKANISRTVQTLKQKGLIGTVWVVKQNENQFGLLFVDGSALTLIPGGAADRSKPEKNKTTTPPRQINNAPVIEMTTLRKNYPKIDIQKNKESLNLGKEVGKGSTRNDWERILARAKAMKENLTEQAA